MATGGLRGDFKRDAAAQFATLAWIDWFNHRRPPEPVGNIRPTKAEKCCDAMLDEPAMAV